MPSRRAHVTPVLLSCPAPGQRATKWRSVPRSATYLVDMLASPMPSHPASSVPRVDEGAANSRWVGLRVMQDKTDQGTETKALTASIPSGIAHSCAHVAKKQGHERT